MLLRNICTLGTGLPSGPTTTPETTWSALERAAEPSSSTPSTASSAPRSLDFIGPVTDFTARAGAEFGNALFYGIAGGSVGNFSGYGANTSVFGPSFGVGVDFQLTQTYFVGIKYLSRTMTGVLQGDDDVEVNLDSISVRAGILF